MIIRNNHRLNWKGGPINLIVLEYSRKCRTRICNRTEAIMTDYSFGCDRLDVYRTQTQAIADCRDTEHDMSAK